MQEEHVSREIIDFFMGQPIFDRINAEELKVVARHMRPVQLKPGQILFHEAEAGNYVCFIVKGELDVIKKADATGRDVLLTTLGPGQSIGEMSIVVGDARRSATIMARTHSDLYILSKSAFDLVLDRHPKIGIKILKGISRLLSEHLRETSSRLADYMPSIS